MVRNAGRSVGVVLALLFLAVLGGPGDLGELVETGGRAAAVNAPLYGASDIGHGVHALSNGVGLKGSALYAQAANPGGVAIWGRNDSEASTDATLVINNDGTGALIKGFGGDRGEDEFRVRNNGTIETKADSYVFVPGSAAVAIVSTGQHALYVDELGRAFLGTSAGSGGTKWVLFPVTLPGVLYGQPVAVEEVTVYYATSTSSSYISRTKVVRQHGYGSGSWTILVANDTRHSGGEDQYSLPITGDNRLSAESGFISVCVETVLPSRADEWICLAGVRVRLGHHSLY